MNDFNKVYFFEDSISILLNVINLNLCIKKAQIICLINYKNISLMQVPICGEHSPNVNVNVGVKQTLSALTFMPQACSSSNIEPNNAKHQ